MLHVVYQVFDTIFKDRYQNHAYENGHQEREHCDDEFTRSSASGFFQFKSVLSFKRSCVNPRLESGATIGANVQYDLQTKPLEIEIEAEKCNRCSQEEDKGCRNEIDNRFRNEMHALRS